MVKQPIAEHIYEHYHKSLEDRAINVSFLSIFLLTEI